MDVVGFIKPTLAPMIVIVVSNLKPTFDIDLPAIKFYAFFECIDRIANDKLAVENHGELILTYRE